MREEKATPFGKYELLERLGVGGMANVYRARYTAAPGVVKPVVIKRVLDELAENPTFVEMFVHEARISVGLSHGNIVHVFDFGQVDGHYFLAMELVDGQPLSRMLKRAQTQGLPQLPQPLAVGIAIEMCKGLHHAHTRTDEQGRPLGLVHRDVSPDNILISYDGEVKVTDFGIAKVQTAGRPITAAGMVKGKYLYLSPEQARGQDDLDARSDVYAVGVVLFRMLCGRLPAEGQDVEVMDRIIRGELTPALQLNPDLDGLLARIVTRALATSRGARFQSAEDLQQELSRWMATRAPLFTSSTLKHLMGWLYQQELTALGRPPSLPQEFQEHVALWRGAQGGGTGAGTGSLTGAKPSSGLEGETRLGLAVGDSSTRETGSHARETQQLDAVQEGSDKSGRGFRRGLGVAAVVGALVLVFLAVRGPPPLEIHSDPPGAQVRLDGEIRGVTPLVLEDVSRNEPHTVDLILLGWRQWEHVYEPGSLDKKVEVALEELEPPAAGPAVAAATPATNPVDPPDEPSAEPSKEPSKESNKEASKEPARTRSSTRSPSPSSPPSKTLRVTAAAKPSPEVAAAKYKQGMKQLSRGSLAKAKELFWECLANEPKSARCFRRLGEVSARMGNRDEALEYYSRFLEIDPKGEGAAQARAYIQGGR